MKTKISDMRSLMESQELDIKVLELEEQADTGRFWYLISTPFNFPKFVIGTVDESLDDVRRVFSCGREDNARRAWTRRETIQDQQ